MCFERVGPVSPDPTFEFAVMRSAGGSQPRLETFSLIDGKLENASSAVRLTGERKVRLWAEQHPAVRQYAQERPGERCPLCRERYAASISLACRRVVAVISSPPSMRATSSIRLA